MSEPIELCDENGNLAGDFTSAENGDAEGQDGASLFDLKKARETLARERDRGVPLAEIWKRLGVVEEDRMVRVIDVCRADAK